MAIDWDPGAPRPDAPSANARTAIDPFDPRRRRAMTLSLTRFPVVPGGTRISFHDSFGDIRRRSDRAHSAIDIGTERGMPVVATTDGLVLREWVSKNGTRLTGAGWSDRGGNIVVIVDAEGFAHYYAHMNMPPLVAPGTPVTAGQPLGEVGNSGSLAEGGPVHLHYQVWTADIERRSERASGIFTRPLGRSINPYEQLAILARGLGASVGRNGGVIFRG
jgi:murein DD-endopeptidase MepM/ murein hydrolase activator NlpD